MYTKEEIMPHFRTERYAVLNQVRWEQFLGMGIPLESKTIFECGAGIGDQTEWLLGQGVAHIHVNDGRAENLALIHERFGYDPRLSYVLGDLEVCLGRTEFQFKVDLVYCYGVYYHINESFDRFHIMKGLARIGGMAAIEYLEGDDTTAGYGYDNPSVALNDYGIRPSSETMKREMKRIWEFVYWPRNQLDWHDPCAPDTPRRIIVGSHEAIKSPQLEAVSA